MHETACDRMVQRLGMPAGRRTVLATLAGAGVVGIAGSDPDAAAAKKKKSIVCLAGQTLTVSKKKQKSFLKRGATLGACPPTPPACVSPGAALQAAINATPTGGTLKLCAGTFSIGNILLLSRNMTLVGAGTEQTILDGGNAVQVLDTGTGVTALLQDLTITQGASSTGPRSLSGGIINAGTLTLRGVAVTACRGLYGGGIFNSDTGVLTLAAGSRVSGNIAIKTDDEGSGHGGGINNTGGTVTLEADSTVSENTAGVFGGGIANLSGTLTLKSGSSVTKNKATNGGGGIFSADGTLVLDAGSSVTDNKATNGGGGILSGGGSVIIDPASSVTGNTPDNCEPDIGACT